VGSISNEPNGYSSYNSMILLSFGVQIRRNRVNYELGPSIAYRHLPETQGAEAKMFLWARLEWPSEITETEFFRKVSTFPRSKENLFVLR